MTVVWVSESGADARRRAHEILADLVARRLDRSPGDVVVGREPSGRPYVPGSDLWVSLSHGRGVVAAAVSDTGPVGVDVERIRPLPALALACRWLSDVDTAWVARHDPPRRVAAFLWLWTQKEALGKARGTGLRGGGLRRPVVLPPGRPRSRALVRHPVPDEPDLSVGATRLPAGVIVAVAAGATAPVRLTVC